MIHLRPRIRSGDSKILRHRQRSYSIATESRSTDAANHARRTTTRHYQKGGYEGSRLAEIRKHADDSESDMKGAAKEMLLGHSTGLDDKYYRPTSGDLLQEYFRPLIH